MSSSFLTVGDIHFKKDNTLETQDLLTFLVKTIANKKKYSFIVLLGDILHSFDKIDLWCFIRATAFIKELASLIKVYVLIGNHDRPNNKVFCEEDVHPFFLLKKEKNIVIVDKPIFERDSSFLFVPYVEDGRFNEAISSFDFDRKRTIIFAHQNFKEARFNSLIKSSCEESFEGMRIISGHIHLEQFHRNEASKSDVNRNNNKNSDSNELHSFLFYCGEKSVYEVTENKIKRLYKPASSHNHKKKERKIPVCTTIKESPPSISFIDYLYKNYSLKDCHIDILKKIS